MDQTLLKEAVPGLGLKAERHRSRNMQAGAEGAFLPHQDSEKADDIFGTDHQYTGAEPSFARLKGADQERVAEDLEGLGWWLQPLGYGFCDEPRNYIYDIEKLSLALSYVVEPEGLIFVKDIKIDDDAIFVKMIPSAMTQMSNNSWGIWEWGMICKWPSSRTHKHRTLTNGDKVNWI